MPNVGGVEVVCALYEATGRNDHEAYRRLIDPEISWEVQENYPHGGTYRSRDAVFEDEQGFFPSLFRQFTDWEFMADEYPDAGEHVVALGRYRGRVVANDRLVDAAYVHVWTVRDGKLARMRQFTDTVAFERAVAAGRS